MSEKYTGKITRETDWGGDESTGFLPVAGSSVQEFIKDELKGKVGAVYKPDGSNFVYYFANEDDKAAYLETGDASLVLDSYEMASKYNVRIDGERLVLSHSVIDGTTGNTAEFYFKIVDENGMTADASARVEFGFTGSGISNKFTMEIPVTAGDWTRVSTNIDKYLRSGSNSVAIKVTGLATQASTQFVMTYNLFDLKFTPAFEYNVAQPGPTISVPYIIECSDTKYLEFFIDGESVESSESQVITDIRKDGNATLNISRLSDGQHSLQVRAYVKATDGTIFYTPSYFYTFGKAGNVAPSFLMSMTMDNTVPVVGPGEPFTIPIVQFEQITFDWSIYDYAERKLNIQFEYDGIPVTTAVIDENGRISTFSYRPMDFGDGKILRVFALGEEEELIFEYEIVINISEAIGGVKETTDGLLLKLQAQGRRNTDVKKDIWQCVGSDGNVYGATFSGFSWNSQQGWNEDTESLVISNGAFVTFNIQPMLRNWVQYGGSVEIDLETFDIENEDAVICECANKLLENEAFFRITATKAELSTANQVSINTRYKDNERLKIAFIGNRAGPHDDGYLIYIVINGVLERAALYKDGDSMTSQAQLSIGDPTGMCKVRLRSIRVYNKAISVDEAFNNFIVDSDDVQGAYERNNVLKEGSATEIGFDEVANKLPVMIFTGDMQDLVDNGQDKEWRNFDVEYINRQEPERNFVSFNCRMKLQGTSSLGYPRKNFKLNTKDKLFNEDIYNASKYGLDPNSVTGNLMLINKTTGEQIDFDDFKTNGTLNNSYCFTLDYQGKPLKKGKYRFRKNAHKAQKWTLKADFMESSCSHNVAAGRSWNDIFENTALLSNGDASYVNQTYKDSALVDSHEYIDYNAYNIEGEVTHYHIENNTEGIKRQRDYVCRTDAQKRCISAEQDDIRTAVDGFPMVCFYRTSHAANDLVFIGQYNFINDKGSYEVFGFEDIEDPEDEETMIYDARKVECWEGLKNTNPLSLFKTIEGFYDRTPDGQLFKWQETYEARYPDPDDYESDPSCLYELSKWLVSTRHVSGETEYSGTINIDASFAKRINTCQYGYTSATTAEYAYAEGTYPDSAEARQKKFETEKWEHFDVWKLAGYYIYLRRYGAVDQFVKNTMLFTDGNGRYDPRKDENNEPDKRYRKWFFINYDNDCLFGLRNNGQLAFHWDLDRQTIDSASDIIDDGQDEGSGSTNSYAMMGHDSTLWNNLEADDEFMRMVRDLDYSMTKYKLNYDNMVKEFDTDQTERWCERIYNANERYKYINAAKGIGDMAGKPVDNLWMLQGTRRSHRHWWIANHFNLLDAQWLSGDYKNTYVEIKTNCTQGTPIRAIAGTKYFYAWGQQKKIYESNMVRDEGDEIVFAFPTDQSQGDPVYIYAFNKMTEMDFSAAASKIYEGSFKFVLDNDLVQNTMKKLVIGNPAVRNTTTQDTTTWGTALPNLEYIDITNFEGINSVPLKSFKNLHTFKAAGSKLGAFDPAEGSLFENVELPSSVKTLSLIDVSFKDSLVENFNYTPNTNLESLTISNASDVGVGRDYYDRIIKPWIDSINSSQQSAELFRGKSLVLRNVKWNFSNLDNIRIFKPFTTALLFQMSGVIDLRQCGNLPMSAIEEIKSIFGENCFNEKLSPLYVRTPDSIFITSEKDEMVAGQENVFSRTIYPDERAVLDKLQDLKYYVVEEINYEASVGTVYTDPITGKKYLVIEDLETVRHGLSLENTRDVDGRHIGILRCEEHVLNVDTELKMLVYLRLTDGSFPKISVMDFTIKDPTYAKTASIDGEKSLYKNKTFVYTLQPKTVAGLAPIGSYTVDWSMSGTDYELYITSSHVNPDNKLEFIVETNQDQPPISSKMAIYVTIHNHDGSTASTEYSVLALNEGVIITEDSNPIVMAICHEKGWAQYENAMTKVEAESVSGITDAFAGITDRFSFAEFRYFTGVTTLQSGAFSASNINEIVFPDTISSIGTYCFDGCSNLSGVYTEKNHGTQDEYRERTLPSGLTIVDEGVFRGCASLGELAIPEGVINIMDYAFGGTSFRRVTLPSSELESECLKLSNTVESLAGYVFETEKWTPETTSNPIEHLEIPTGVTITDYSLLYGRNYVDFAVEYGHTKYAVDEYGVLVTAGGDAVLRYPPMAPYLETYTLPGVSIINQYAFFAVKNLSNIVADNNSPIAVIQEGFCMDSDIEDVNIYNCIALANGEIPDSAFRNCRYLTSFTFPRGSVIKKIGLRAFENCESLESLTFPQSLEEFVTNARGFSYAISHCQSLTGLTFPDSVTKMGTATIVDCDNLVDVVLPAYLDYTQYDKYDEWGHHVEYGVHSDQFAIISGCSNLTGVTLPAFSIDVEGEEEGEIVSKTINRNLFNDRFFIKNTPNEDYEDPSEMYWKNRDIYGFPLIVNGSIAGGFISDTFNMIEYRLPEADNGNEYIVASGCVYSSNGTDLCGVPKGLSTINIKESVRNILNHACYEMSKLNGIEFPSELETIGETAFKACTGITTVVFPDTLRNLDGSAFNGARITGDLILPESLESLGQNCFQNNNITKVVINGDPYVNEHGFEGNPIVEIVINGDATLGGKLFNISDNGNSEYLEKITIKGSPSFDSFTIRRASKLKTIILSPTGGTLPTFSNNTVPSFPFYQAGLNYTKEERKLYISLGGEALIDSAPRRRDCDWHYVKTGELNDGTIEAGYSGFTIVEALPITEDADVVVYVDGQPFASTIYATSSLGNLVGPGGAPYSTNYIGGKYVFELDGLYDGEVVTLYSNSTLTNEIGSFVARILTDKYQVGEPALGRGTKSLRSAPVETKEDDEIVSIKKSEYDSLVSKVDQMMRLMNKLIK